MKRMVILLVALVCTSCHPGSSRRDVDEALDRAFEMFKQSEYEPLLKELDRIQAIAPSHYLVYETRAWTLDAMEGGGENMDETILSNLNKAIGLDPSKAGQSYHLRGVVHQRQRNLDSAIQDYSKAIDLLPEEPRMYNTYLGRSGAFAAMSNYVAAIRDAKRAAKLQPDQYRPYLLMVMSYRDLGDREEAVQWLAVAERLAPTNPVVTELKEELGVE